MKTKPWPILIIAFLHFVAPVANILFVAHVQDMTVVEYLQIFWDAKNYLDLFMVLGLLPLAGLSIYLVKSWSYLAFLAISGVEIFSNVDNWLAYPDNFSFPLLILAHIVNIAIVGYFLVPAVRAPYFDPKLRWWEQKPRFNVNIRGVIQPLGTVAHNKSQCRVIDISEGGALVKTKQRLCHGDVMKLTFSYFGLSLVLQGKVVHLKRDNGWVYGVQFYDLEKDTQNRIGLQRLTQAMRLLGIRPAREKVSRTKDFLIWAGLLRSRREQASVPLASGSRGNVLPFKPNRESESKEAA